MDKDTESLNLANKAAEKRARQEKEQEVRQIYLNNNRKKQSYEQQKRLMQKPLRNSLRGNPIKYTKAKRLFEKKQVKDILQKTVATILATTTIALTSYASVKATQAITSSKYVLAPKKEASIEVNDRIEYYQSIMSGYADETTRIETYLDTRNPNYVNDSYVDYTDENIENLADHLINAANEGEVELRCAILAAYKEINEPYRNSVLEDGFKTAINKEEGQTTCLTSLIKEKDNSYTLGFLESLGYENWEEYNNNERENIKEIEAIEQYSKSKHKGV